MKVSSLFIIICLVTEILSQPLYYNCSYVETYYKPGCKSPVKVYCRETKIVTQTHYGGCPDNNGPLYGFKRVLWP